jgi:predicted nucleic acid-binding protein
VTRFVIDASVAIKWYLAEEHSVAATRLLSQEHERIAPELILVEAAQVLAKRARLEEISASEAQASVVALRDSIQLAESASLVSAALDIALAHRRSVYDSLYVALALRETCQLVTADRRLYNALSLAFRDTMFWIGDVRSEDES